MGNVNLAPRGAIGMRLCNELDGLLRGIQADGIILPAETARIAGWLEANRTYTSTHPFSELATHLERALADGLLTSERRSTTCSSSWRNTRR